MSQELGVAEYVDHKADPSRMLHFRWDEETGSSAAGPSAQLGRQIRSELAAASGYGNLTVYVNYAQGDETLEQIYGAQKLPRLAGLKAKYDPDNIFTFNNPLPLKYP